MCPAATFTLFTGLLALTSPREQTRVTLCQGENFSDFCLSTLVPYGVEQELAAVSSNHYRNLGTFKPGPGTACLLVYDVKTWTETGGVVVYHRPGALELRHYREKEGGEIVDVGSRITGFVCMKTDRDEQPEL